MKLTKPVGRLEIDGIHDGECVRGWGSDPDVCDCAERAGISMNVRVGNTSVVHAITPAAHSVILNKSAAPTCGAYLGRREVPRVVTSEPVTCKRCQRTDVWSASLVEFPAL